MVILAARDNADFRFAYHTRATHSTLTISQRSLVMLVGVTPNSILISVQTVVTAKKKQALASGSAHSSLHMVKLKHRQQAREENLAYFPPRIDPGIICINLWGEAFVYWTDELGLPAKTDQWSSFKTQNGQSEAECLLSFWPPIFTGTC